MRVTVIQPDHQSRIVGVEASHSFGDALFNLPLIRELGKKFSCGVGVAIQQPYADALHNIPWISEIIHIPGMHHGMHQLASLGYQHIYQITQNEKFFEFCSQDPTHSLIDTPLLTGRQLGLQDFDQRPIFIPTTAESDTGATYGQQLHGQRLIAIECIAKSGQSWADQAAIQMIIDKHINTHRILWLSNQGAPEHPNIDNLLRFSRRQAITLLQHCEIFYSVGSGFFCASLALQPQYQPRKIVCMWINGFYKYEGRVERWHGDITWTHNHTELHNTLQSLG